jgi:DNA-binding LacI/PurR family transcriptional regulator
MNDLSLNSQRYDRQFLWQGILDGVQRTTSENGFLLNLIGPETPLQHEDTSPSAALWNHVNGLILHPAAHVNSECVDFIEAACTRGFPVVLVDRYFEELTTDRVVFNDEEVGFILTEFLINQGHTQIAFALTNEPSATSVRNRLNGYRSALEHSGIVFDDQLILDIYSQNAVETHLRLLQEMATKKFTAVFTANDPTTEKLLFDLIRLNHDRLKEINLRVSAGETVNALSFPEIALTIAMIGDVISPYYRNYISIIARHSGYKLGQAAARLLIGRVNGKITGPPQTVIVPMEIMEFE